ncbi:aminoglycoside phosphotransferase family protein [Streptomyces sp. NPDC032472]|uniref:aminoglycoside phosphotransferase family protein n=1 Tax=Streptomyces sp. NPDC032472 TaxID=3155018 RepID=UPI0033F5011C
MTTELVRQLVRVQFPQWGHLPLRPVAPGGSDHVIHRLGPELSVRLPRHPDAVGQAEKEALWLPRFAGHLPLAVPQPVAVGRPGLGYPWPWAVSRWLDGEVATVEALAGSVPVAEALAGFLTALQRFPTAGASAEPAGRLLSGRDAATRAAIRRTAGAFDSGALLGVWEEALAAGAWDRPPVWCHGDFHTGNVLTSGGRPSAVIDFGELGIGDPACYLTLAFTLLSGGARAAFRTALGVDDATWARGRGWALATGLNAYVHYADTEPRVARQTTRQIEQALIG